MDPGLSKDLISRLSTRHSLIVSLYKEGRLKEAIELCHQRLFLCEDLELRLLLFFLLRDLGYGLLAEQELRSIRESILWIQGALEGLSVKGEGPVPFGGPLEATEPVVLEGILGPGGGGEEATVPGDLGPASQEEPQLQLDLKDLYTPALAELYLEQGAIGEAMEVYSTYLSQNPHDQEAQRRFSQLKAQVAKSPDPREELIGILERWLQNLRPRFAQEPEDQIPWAVDTPYQV